jgi:UDP-N-acetyl-D-glucosamine dehydrogenase
MTNFRKVSIVGLGYVGLSLVKSLCDKGYRVLGVDIDSERVEELLASKTPNESISDSDLKSYIDSGLFHATTNPALLKDIDTVIIAVPTPLSEGGEADYRFLVSACELISNHLKSDALLINESTSHPGTLRDLIAPIVINSRSDMGKDIKFACSPERVNPGDLKFTHANTPRVVSGLDDVACQRVRDFYSDFVGEVFLASTAEVAEMSKLLENSFRLVNISFINEISDYCLAKGISVREVIAAASTKPFGFMPFYPGAGVGGHCIPVDPVYLIESAKAQGCELPLLNGAIKSNEERHNSITSHIGKELEGLKGKSVLLVGVAYKSNVSDTRETPANRIFDGLRKAGADVHWHDPLVSSWNESQSTDLNSRKWDAALVLTVHKETDISELLSHSKVVFDSTGVVPKSGDKVKPV